MGMHGKRHSEETRKKMSLAQKGRTFSAETIELMRKVRLGKRPSEETRRKMSISHTGLKRTEEFKKNRTGKLNGNFGRKHTEEERKKMSEAQKNRIHTPEIGAKISKALKGKLVGEKNPAWRGGITPINQKVRNSKEYALWRRSVFQRDGHQCVWCGAKEVRLEADHIKPFALFPELRFAIDNGRTLCSPCHKKTDTYGWRSIKKI